jgi:hypothetical protein
LFLQLRHVAISLIGVQRAETKNEESGRDLETLTKKRTKGRSRDRQYSRQSLGESDRVKSKPILPQSLPGAEILLPTKARLAAEMELRTAARLDQLTSPSESPVQPGLPSGIQNRAHHLSRSKSFRPPFLMKDIPSSTEAPEVHAQLHDLLAIRQQYQEDNELALYDGDIVQEEYAGQQYVNVNEQMHSAYDSYVAKKASLGDDDLSLGRLPSGPENESSSIHSSYIGIDELPLPTVFARTAQTPLTPRQPTRAIPVAVASPLCPSSQVPFRIWIGYMADEVSMTIWDSIPNFNIYAFALNWITQTFHGDYSTVTLILTRHAGQQYSCAVLIPRVGVAFDIPLNAEDNLTITFSSQVDYVSANTRPSPVHPDSDSDYEDNRGLPDKSFDKLRQNFKLPKFTGNAKDWKLWNQGLMRYLSIWELDHVTDPAFFDILPLSIEQRKANKLVFYILEDAVSGSPLARSYVQKAALNNGFEAYYTLLDGFVFAGATTASLLLNGLTNFRFKKDETPTAFCLRLEELFQDLKSLPGDAAMVFNDTQCIGYLLGALRHEKEWAHVHSTITSHQIKGTMSFAEACDELRMRCEASRAHETMDRSVTNNKVSTLVGKVNPAPESVTAEQVMAFISTMSMKHNVDTSDAPKSTGKNPSKGKARPLFVCLAKDCSEETHFPLCGTHYHLLIAAKIRDIELKQNYGNATYNPETKLVVYPATIPSDRMPSNVKRVRGGAAAV